MILFVILQKIPPLRLPSPDSGIATNGSTPVDKPDLKLSHPEPLVAKSKTKPSKKKRKKRALELQTLHQTGHYLPKPPVLPPVKADVFLLTQPDREPSPPASGRRKGGLGDEVRRGDFDSMLQYMDATMVSEWLTRSNTALEDMTTFCQQGDNFVQFAHFWLTDFPEVQKQEIYQMEHEILMEEVGLAFAVGKEARQIVRRDCADLVSALFREYPTKLFSTRGSVLFMDYLDVLTSDRSERYKKLLSDVRCSTRNKQYAQWLLATRSFALVSMWSAIVNFYRNLLGQHGVPPGLPVPVVAFGSSQHTVYQRRLLQAVRYYLYFYLCSHIYLDFSCSHNYEDFILTLIYISPFSYVYALLHTKKIKLFVYNISYVKDI